MSLWPFILPIDVLFQTDCSSPDFDPQHLCNLGTIGGVLMNTIFEALPPESVRKTSCGRGYFPAVPTEHVRKHFFIRLSLLARLLASNC